ncbi:MAG: hypothetical protein K5678_13830 [Acetatifactor sp.]|nr:hypothetical protein [Acetatifactor sp.]
MRNALRWLVVCGLCFSMQLWLPSCGKELLKQGFEHSMEEMIDISTEMIQNEEISITEPWVYPIQLGSNEWKSMDITDAVALLDIPENIVDAMTTTALFESVISYPLIDGIFAYDNTYMGINAIRGRFYALDMFLLRKDALDILESELESLDVLIKDADENEKSELEQKRILVQCLWNYIGKEDSHAWNEGQDVERNY